MFPHIIYLLICICMFLAFVFYLNAFFIPYYRKIALENSNAKVKLLKQCYLYFLHASFTLFTILLMMFICKKMNPAASIYWSVSAHAAILVYVILFKLRELDEIKAILAGEKK